MFLEFSGTSQIYIDLREFEHLYWWLCAVVQLVSMLFNCFLNSPHPRFKWVFAGTMSFNTDG